MLILDNPEIAFFPDQVQEVGDTIKDEQRPARSALPFQLVVNTGNIGSVAYASGPQIYFFDSYSLANPIGSHTSVLTRGRPGHEKFIGPAWMVARFGIPGEELPKDAASPLLVKMCIRDRSKLRRGALSVDDGETMRVAADSALTLRIPIVLVLASSGADVSDGVASLHGWGQAARALAQCSGVVPVVVVVTGPAISGPALLLGLADLVVMTSDAFAFVSGPAMVEEFTGVRIGIHQLEMCIRDSDGDSR